MANLSRHGAKRCRQRNLSVNDIAFVKQYGQKIHRTGICFYFLGKRDIPKDFADHRQHERLEGTTLLIAPDNTLITAYRNRLSIKAIKRSKKYQVYQNAS